MEVYSVLRYCLLVLVAVTGDYAVHLQQHNDILRALSDNATHAAIGFLTWFNVVPHLGRLTSLKGKVLAQSFLCALISSAIDLDHFISARSFHLKDATKLEKRPFLHCTTVAFLAFILILLVAIYYNSVKLEIFGWIVLAAFLSHHIRDAARRGFWFFPLGSTSPLGNGIYLVLTAALPVLLSFMINLTNRLQFNAQLSDSSVLIV